MRIGTTKWTATISRRLVKEIKLQNKNTDEKIAYTL